MFKPQAIIQSCDTHVKLKHIPDHFKLLSWNIYKINHKTPAQYHAFMQMLHRTCHIHFYLLQEAQCTKKTSFPIYDFCFHFAANLQMRLHAFGVMTASNVLSHQAQQILSKKTEFLFKTHKSSLVNHYQFSDGTPLIIINVHAINFKDSRAYADEIAQLQNYLYPYEDIPTIIAGDFNSWNRKRNALIADFCRQLNFNMAQFEDAQHIKHFSKHPLDLVLYKNIHCECATALDSQKISDHNPLLLRFSKIPES